MWTPLVYAILIITGARITALGHYVQLPPLDTEGDIFVDTFVDYLLSLLRLFLPNAMTYEESEERLITVRNASVYGLRHIERGGPTVLKLYSTPDNDYINCLLSLDLKNYIKVDGFFQISTFLFDSGFSPAIMQLFDFIVEVNLTLTLPKIYAKAYEALLQFDGVPNVEMSKLNFTQPTNAEEESKFGFMSFVTGFLSGGPLGGIIEAKIARSISLVIKGLNEKLQETVGEFVDNYG
ncbi:hypothetical protein Aperf_G00000024606 [Anoplocephala perfoliata]